MIRVERTDSDNLDFIQLVKQLDADLAERDGADHSFYNQFNKINKLKNVIVLYNDETPTSCGAMKEFSPEAMEVKRMYTLPSARGKGFAGMVLSEIERWAAELHYNKCVLETGKNNLKPFLFMNDVATASFQIMDSTSALITAFVLQKSCSKSLSTIQNKKAV